MARIVEQTGGGREWELCAGKHYFLIGRRPENDIVIAEHMGVSGFHAAILNQESDYWIISYGKNGTFYSPDGAEFGVEHFIKNFKNSEVYDNLKQKAEPAAVAELKKSQEKRAQTIGPGHFVPRTEVRDSEIIMEIVRNSSWIEEIKRAATKLDNRGYIAMPAANFMNSLRVFRVLF